MGPVLALASAACYGFADLAGGLLARRANSVGIAIQYLAVAQADPSSGIWPIAAGRVTAVLSLLPLALAVTTRRPLPGRIRAQAVLTGGGAALGLILYLLATRDELLTTTVVLASLYPVVPVVFGVTLLGERLSDDKILGLVTAAVAVVLLAAP